MNTKHDVRPRKNEAPWHLPRSDRAFPRDSRWFFRTREGIELGPYASHERAEIAAAQLAIMLDGISDMEITAQFIREFMLLKMI